MRSAGGSLVQINVATLLQEPVGNTRTLSIEDEDIRAPSFDYNRIINGDVRLIRTERGVLASVRVKLDIPLECARCLDEFNDELALQFDEEFVLGSPLPVTKELPEHDQGDFLVDDHWHLDLCEAVRQYEQSALPLIALCRPDCPGFDAAVPAEPAAPSTADRRWSALSGLAERLHEEESDGASQA